MLRDGELDLPPLLETEPTVIVEEKTTLAIEEKIDNRKQDTSSNKQEKVCSNKDQRFVISICLRSILAQTQLFSNLLS